MAGAPIGLLNMLMGGMRPKQPAMPFAGIMPKAAQNSIDPKTRKPLVNAQLRGQS